MTLQGDLATLDMAALLQNLEGNDRTGTLSVDCAGGKAHVLFREGSISAFGREGRPSLMESLVSSGAISRTQLDRVERKNRGARHSLGELLVASGAVTQEALVEAARSRLIDDVCELVVMEAGEFAFHRGGVPRDVFDPEERRLELSLPTGPLLLEAARRADHWALIRTWIPSDSSHLAVQRRPEPPKEGPLRGIADRLLQRLDGTRSVAEVVCAFPHHRFEVYQLLADWLKAKSLRPVGSEDMLRIARRLAPVDPPRALTIVERALEDQPRHPELLRERERLAESLEEPAAAVEALKLLVHVELASGDREGARADLKRARELAPFDTALWEKSLSVALEDRSIDEALCCGERLAELYREPGLHRRASAIFGQLVELAPQSWRLRRELARSKVDSGDVVGAIDGLERHGRKLIAGEEYGEAREVFQAVLEYLPAHEGAREAIDKIDAQVFAARRGRVGGWTRVAIAGGVLMLGLWILSLEISARRAYSAAQRSVSELGLIEAGRYAEAIAAFEEVAERHPWTPTVLFDVRSRLSDLRAKQGPPTGGAQGGE